MDIISLPVEYDRDRIDGRFRLVNIAALRAKDLIFGGSKPRVPTKSKKVTTIAIEEAVKGALEFITGEEALKAREEAKKIDFHRLIEEKKREVETEDLSELEKDLKIYIHEKETVEESGKPNEAFEPEE